MIDTTGSMEKLLFSTIETVKSIVQNFGVKNLKQNIIRYAAVSYKDHHKIYKVDNIVESQDFSTADIVLEFLSKLKAKGGDD